jgi:hypothetical protein
MIEWRQALHYAALDSYTWAILTPFVFSIGGRPAIRRKIERDVYPAGLCSASDTSSSITCASTKAAKKISNANHGPPRSRARPRQIRADPPLVQV